MNDTWTVLSDQPGLQVIGTIMVFFERVEYFQCTLVRNKYIYITLCIKLPQMGQLKTIGLLY